MEDDNLKRRRSNANMDFPGHILRLDLYRLLAYFYASKSLAALSDGEYTCQFTDLRQQYERSEIIRILSSSAAAIRWAGFGHIDEHRAFNEWLEKEIVGELVKDVTNPSPEPLNMREACNKIIHCKHTELPLTQSTFHWEQHLDNPIAILHAEFRGNNGWMAKIDIERFVDVGSDIASAFSAH